VGLIRKLTFILLCQLLAICILIAQRINDQSVVTLLIFNFLFIILFTQLKGDVLTKLSLIVAGNVLGLLWNYVFHLLILNAATPIIQPMWLRIFYTVAYPCLNIFWVIAFWSFSLTRLTPINSWRHH